MITEATGLNFPEGAVTESLNTRFLWTGAAQRRLGIDIESQGETTAYDPTTDGVVHEFVWQAVSNIGGFTFLVVQVGVNIYFFEMTTNASLSAGKIPHSIDLRNYKAPGAGDIKDFPASFASGAGFLFVTHPNCDPVLVKFDSIDNKFKIAKVTVLVRDFDGVQDNLSVEEQPVNLSTEHHYNLKNQGWNRYVYTGANSSAGSGTASTDPIVSHRLEFEDLN